MVTGQTCIVHFDNTSESSLSHLLALLQKCSQARNCIKCEGETKRYNNLLASDTIQTIKIEKDKSVWLASNTIQTTTFLSTAPLWTHLNSTGLKAYLLANRPGFVLSSIHLIGGLISIMSTLKGCTLLSGEQFASKFFLGQKQNNSTVIHLFSVYPLKGKS